MAVTAHPQRQRASGLPARQPGSGARGKVVAARGRARPAARRIKTVEERAFVQWRATTRFGVGAWRVAVALTRAGALWPTLAAGVLLAASLNSWLIVPLEQVYGPWGLAVNIGWGETSLISYGLLTVVAALALLAIPLWNLRSLNWRELPQGAAPTRRLTTGAQVGLLLIALAPVALFLFQMLFVDMRLLETLAKQENDYLLIALHLGYSLDSQRFKMIPFLITVGTPQDRMVMLLQLAGFGPELALLAVLPSLVGVYLAWRAAHDERRMWLAQALKGANGAALDDDIDESEDADALEDIADSLETTTDRQRLMWRWRVALIAAAVLVGLIIFGRAPAGLLFEYLGSQSFASGDYVGALNWYSSAQTLTPTLDDSLAFHTMRGEAQYELGQRSGMDVDLYLSDQYRLLGSLDQAWQVDQTLYALYPHTPVVIHEMMLTVEAQAELNTRVPYTNGSDASPAPLRQDALHTIHDANKSVTAVDQALPWLNELFTLDPNNVYAHYLRGRIYLAARAYSLAASDFQSVVFLSHDDDMLSAAYTYLAFCDAGQGDLVHERLLLLHAVELDYGYNNNTAREALSGLH